MTGQPTNRAATAQTAGGGKGSHQAGSGRNIEACVGRSCLADRALGTRAMLSSNRRITGGLSLGRPTLRRG